MPQTEQKITKSENAQQARIPYCDWCGAQPQTLINFNGETTQGHRHALLFCNKSCHDAYKGG